MIKKTLKTKLIGMVTAMLVMANIVGCGSNTNLASNETNDVVQKEEVSTIEESSIVEETTFETSEEISYIEHENYYENENFDWAGDVTLTIWEEGKDIVFTPYDGVYRFVIYDSVDLYSTNEKVLGYTKPNAVVQIAETADDWYCIYIDDATLFVKASDFDGNSAEMTEWDDILQKYVIPERDASSKEVETSIDEVASTNEATTSKEDTSSNTTSKDETSTNNSNTSATSEVETQVVEVSDKYTPEEAVAVWRGILEANGMTWDPSLKNGANWGTGWLELKKGKPEEYAQMDLKGYAYGDGAGHSRKYFYAEITSYDDNKVYMTSWSD
jgi:hypothetical protein